MEPKLKKKPGRPKKRVYNTQNAVLQHQQNAKERKMCNKERCDDEEQCDDKEQCDDEEQCGAEEQYGAEEQCRKESGQEKCGAEGEGDKGNKTGEKAESIIQIAPKSVLPVDRKRTMAAKRAHVKNSRAKLIDSIRRSERMRMRHANRRLSVEVFDYDEVDPDVPSITDCIAKLKNQINRPKFYRNNKSTVAAIAKRRQRANACIPKELRKRIQNRGRNKFERLTVLGTLKLAVDLKLKSRALRIAARRLRCVLAPIRQCERMRRAMFEKSGFLPIPRAKGLQRSLQRTLKELTEAINIDAMPKPLKILISLDGGGDGILQSTKIVVQLPDGPKPCSPNRCSILAFVFGKEGSETLTDVLTKLNHEIGEVKAEGLVVDGVSVTVEFFLIGDLKMIAICMGLQGCSAISPCPFCLINKYKLDEIDPENPPTARDIDTMVANYEIFQPEFDAATKSAQPGIRQKHGSIDGKPLLTNIPIKNIVPPILHLIMGVVNESFAELKKEDPERANNLLIESQRTLEKGRKSSFIGREGRALVAYICALPEEERDDVFMEAFVAIEPLFTVAKVRADLTNAESVIRDVIHSFRQLRGLTPKLHVLEIHVPEFIKNHQTWGNMSEQGLESLHRWFNERAKDVPGKRQIIKSQCFITDHLIRMARED